MNGKPLQKALIKFFKFSIHFDWVDVVLSVENNILVCWFKLNALFVNDALL